MASPLSVLKRVIPLNLVHVESWETVTRTVERYGESLEADEIRVHARPFRREQCRCPKCGRNATGTATGRRARLFWLREDVGRGANALPGSPYPVESR